MGAMNLGWFKNWFEGSANLGSRVRIPATPTTRACMQTLYVCVCTYRGQGPMIRLLAPHFVTSGRL